MKSWLLVCFVSVCLLVLCNSGSLFTTRVLSELRDINKQKLSLNDPFNNSRYDCGIRLSPINRYNLQNWHFSFTGMEGTAFEGGIYHGVIKLHKDYPRKAPSVSMNTPSGRWKLNEDICLSASSHHQEMWNPDWNLRTLVLSLRAFMITQPLELGGITASIEERMRLAKLSRDWSCPECGTHHNHLLDDIKTMEIKQRQFNRDSRDPNEIQLTRVPTEKSAKKTHKTRFLLIKTGAVIAALGLILYNGLTL